MRTDSSPSTRIISSGWGEASSSRRSQRRNDGVDLLLDCAGGQTRNQAVGAVRDAGRVISIVLPGPPAQLERGITGESFAAHGGRERLEALSRLVDAGTLRPQVEAVLPLDQAREALARVASRHTRGKIVLRP